MPRFIGRQARNPQPVADAETLKGGYNVSALMSFIANAHK